MGLSDNQNNINFLASLSQDVQTRHGLPDLIIQNASVLYQYHKDLRVHLCELISNQEKP